jgi:CDP-6-deoxy-D-xylo-4-hexulose-3-dehydrase
VAFSTLTSPKLGDRAIKPGDEVIGVAAGFPTTVNPILQFGAVPVFVDVDPRPRYNIDASKIEAAIGPKTKAIMLAHSLGNPFNLDVVTALCKPQLWLVEDCCDALGSTYAARWSAPLATSARSASTPRTTSPWAKAARCSPTTTNSSASPRASATGAATAIASPARTTPAANALPAARRPAHGYDHKYTYSHLGYNLKITDMQAACGLAQLKKRLPSLQARKSNFAFLKERLKDCEEFVILPGGHRAFRSVLVRLPDHAERELPRSAGWTC